MALYNCSNCKEQKAYLTQHGHFECRGCGAIFWTIFDRPKSGSKGPGKKCSECGSMNLFLVAQMGEVEVLRCSACAFTLLRPAE
jgi:DNA-directed RNA polymerase subunit RPC12/RpoP